MSTEGKRKATIGEMFFCFMLFWMSFVMSMN